MAPPSSATRDVQSAAHLLTQEPDPTSRRPRSAVVSVLRLSWIPALLASAGVVAALVYSFNQRVLYEARSEVVVSPGTKFLDPQIADAFPRIATTVQEIALTQVVLQDAERRLALRGVAVPSLDWLRDHLRLTISGDTPVLAIAGVAVDEQTASRISSAETEALAHAIAVASAAGATATVLTNPVPAPVARAVRGGAGAAATRPRGLTLTIFSKGEYRGKIQPQPARNALLGGNAGLLLGCFLIAFLISRPRSRHGT